MSNKTRQELLELSKVYYLEVDPIPWARPAQTTTRTGKSRRFDTQIKLKEMIRHALLFQHGNDPKFSGPLSVSLNFHLKLPHGYSKKTIQAFKGQPHFKRPDLDNLIKFILDAADVLWDDDCLVAHIEARKIYATEKPHTEFIIKRLD